MRLLEIVLMNLGGVWQGVRQDWNLFEIALIAGGVWAWKKGWRPHVPSLPAIHRPWVWAAGIAVGVVALRLALIPVLPVPVPIVTDEFSHLLLADTLAHGRLTNPTHPFWPHFESIHIIQRPHYASNYFPGHAAVLALGQVVLGNPWAGVLGECAGFLLLLYWALRGWMPPRWAVFGTLIAALRFAIGSYWINAYHGGFLPAAGGALVAGAFARLRKQDSAWLAALLGLGMAILCTTRPFEGVLYCLPFLAVLAWERRQRIPAVVKIAVISSIPVTLALAALGIYFKSVTGSPFVTAYQISQKTYGWPMALAWTPPPHVTEPHIEFQRYYEYEVSEHQKVDGPLDFIEFLTFRVQEYWRFFIGPFLTIPLIMLGRVWRRRRILLGGAMGALAAVMLEGAASPHYLAPATAMIVAVIVECCRYLSPARARIVPLLAAGMVVVLGLRIGAAKLGLPFTQRLNFQSWCCRVTGDLDKSRITAELERIPGQHLVFVQAKDDQAGLFQWVYNSADIDHQRIVWARDLGPQRNTALAAYFAGRRVWVLNPNVTPAALSPVEGAMVAGASR